jgi:hypothetical protein
MLETTAMASCVWFIQAANSSTYARHFTPAPLPDRNWEEYRRHLIKVEYRARAGEPVSAEDLPSHYVPMADAPPSRLTVPMWNADFVHVRDDMAEVMRRFDLGRTVLKPITVSLPRGRGEETRYLTLLTLNLRETIDPAASRPVPASRKRRTALRSDTRIIPNVKAFPSALEGPAIWTDPMVLRTLFVNDALARALLAEPFGKALGLKQVELSAPA